MRAALEVATVIVCVILVAVTVALAYQRRTECHAKSCPGAQQPELVDNKCMCITVPK